MTSGFVVVLLVLAAGVVLSPVRGDATALFGLGSAFWRLVAGFAGIAAKRLLAPRPRVE